MISILVKKTNKKLHFLQGEKLKKQLMNINNLVTCMKKGVKKKFTPIRSFEIMPKETIQEGQNQSTEVELSGRHSNYDGDSFSDPKLL